MKLAIHQPEHFPYDGFFQKMSSVDVFVILDDVKFKKNDFQNRNRFTNFSNEFEWFGFPVSKKSNSQIIHDVVPLNDEEHNWKNKVVRKLEMNLKADPDEMFQIYSHDSLIKINMASIEWCRKKLGITTPIIFSSEIEKIGSKSDLLLQISQKLGATTYVSGQGGKNYLDVEIFKESNIKVEFFEPIIENYNSALQNILRK